MSPAPVPSTSHGHHPMSVTDCWTDVDLPGTTVIETLLTKRQEKVELETPDNSDISPIQSPRTTWQPECWELFLEQNVDLLACKVDTICKALRSRDAYIRTAALGALGRIAAAGMFAADAEHKVAALAARRLEDNDADVREAAAVMLEEVNPKELARHVPAITRRMEDGEASVRAACVDVLGRLAGEIGNILGTSDDGAANHGCICLAAFGCLSRRLRDHDAEVREAALEALGNLEPDRLARHAPAIIRSLQDEKHRVRKLAVWVLGKLASEDLQEHSSAIAGALGGGDCLLHYAASIGCLDLVTCLVARHRNVLLHASNFNEDTPLHLAAEGGHLKICRSLIQSGALVKARNILQQTPAELAYARGHLDVVEDIEARENLTTTRGGTGDALYDALKDMRPVVGVEWYTIKMPGVVGIVGGIHSLLAVTVGRTGESTHTYVVEKAARVRGDDNGDPEMYRNGVHVSHWLDVVSNVDGHPIHTLERCDIMNSSGQPVLCMTVLREIAVDMGPYDVSSSNCHHACLAMYNVCAQERLRVPTIPNSFLVWCSSLLRTVGLDVATSNSATSGSNIQSASVSASQHSHEEEDHRAHGSSLHEA